MKTPQRKTLYKVLRASDRPLSRAEILDLARMEMPRLGSATVGSLHQGADAKFSN